jgi:hypothetical protein
LFNLGIEAAQIAVILATLTAFFILRNAPPNIKIASATTSAWLIGSVSTFWLLDRLVPFF